MDASCLKLEFDIQGPRLYCRAQGMTDLVASKRALMDVVAVQLRYQLAQLVLVDQTELLDAPQASRAAQFELALYFSEWFRGVSVAVVGGAAGLDWPLICEACRANGLRIERFDQLDRAEAWLSSLPVTPGESFRAQSALATTD
jgi:hypothetical protein